MIKNYPLHGVWGVDMRPVNALLALAGFGGFFVRTGDEAAALAAYPDARPDGRLMVEGQEYLAFCIPRQR